MASLLKLGALIPAALRVTLSGGAVYGSVKYGVWTDSKNSPEKLERLKKSVEREMEYPKTTWKFQKLAQGHYTSTSLAPPPPSSPDHYASIFTSAVDGWNRMVMNMCEFLASVDGSTMTALGSGAEQWLRQKQDSSK